MKREGKVVLMFMGSLWCAMLLYILLHEGGHALTAALCGAKIIEFNILEGYVMTEGGRFSEMTLALFYAAGMLAPVIVFTIHLMLYPRGTDRAFYRIFSAVFTGMILFSIGVWIVVPVQYMTGRANPNDDVTQFIETLKISPLIIVALAGLLMSIYVWAVWKKKIFQNGCAALKLGGYEEVHESDYRL